MIVPLAEAHAHGGDFLREHRPHGIPQRTHHIVLSYEVPAADIHFHYAAVDAVLAETEEGEIG